MPELVRTLMTTEPVCLPATASMTRVAEQMRDHAIGDVLIVDGDRLRGIVTDRDVVIRGLATHADPESTTAGELATPAPVFLGPDDTIDYAVRMMREHGVRRLPVCEDSQLPIGIVTLGDLAMVRDPDSALADISAADPNA